MKVALKIIIAILTINSLWSASQKDVNNMVLSMVFLPVVILILFHPKFQKNNSI